ncbi:hypothetical protein XI08_05820 [Bradyrhizobium sp. CCBAU 11361]|nr:hypothetical protein [Bradyrhizobium sp. CCBAU 11361]MDA9488739.1 hypothetical protein [Bradyrhizobium sp. CCBAU 11361]
MFAVRKQLQKGAALMQLELAAGVEPVNGRIHIEKINAPFLSKNGYKGTGAEFGAGIRYAVEKGWLDLHESGTYVRLLSGGDHTIALSATT